MKLAYVMGTEPSAQALANIEAGKAPRAEYNVFLQRHPAKLITFADTAKSGSKLAGYLCRRNQASWALAITALKGDFDAFIATGEDVGLPLALLAKVRCVKRPIYIITHGSYFASAKFAKIMMLLRSSRNVHFLALSQSLADRMVDTFGVPAARSHNTSYATDCAFFKSSVARTAIQRDAVPILSSVGAAHRDYRTLVKAVADLPVQVKIGADSAWFPCAVDIEGDQMPANVDVRKYAYPELKQLYDASLFVVIPLYPGKHACGYSAIAEAMAMGKAVIATKTTNHSDFLIDGENGLYVRPNDTDDLRTKIQYLLDNPDEAICMGTRGRERMERDYSVEAYSAKIEKVVGL